MLLVVLSFTVFICLCMHECGCLKEITSNCTNACTKAQHGHLLFAQTRTFLFSAEIIEVKKLRAASCVRQLHADGMVRLQHFDLKNVGAKLQPRLRESNLNTDFHSHTQTHV